MTRTLFCICLALWAFLLFACSRGANEKPTSKLTISAAADLMPAFEEIGKLFEQESGIKVSFNFSSTGQLAQQIEQGAPVDLFAAAREAMQSAGVFEQVKSKLVFGENIAQTLQYAESGNVDAAIVALSLSTQSKG